MTKTEAIELNREEMLAIKSMQRLSGRWPKTLWLFVGDDGLMAIMKCKSNGGHAHNPDGTIDHSYIVDDSIKINCDGGEW